MSQFRAFFRFFTDKAQTEGFFAARKRYKFNLEIYYRWESVCFGYYHQKPEKIQGMAKFIKAKAIALNCRVNSCSSNHVPKGNHIEIGSHQICSLSNVCEHRNSKAYCIILSSRETTDRNWHLKKKTDCTGSINWRDFNWSISHAPYVRTQSKAHVLLVNGILQWGRWLLVC